MKRTTLLVYTILLAGMAIAQPTHSLNAFSKLSLAEKDFTLTGTFKGITPQDSLLYCKVVYNHLYQESQVSHVTTIDPSGKFSITFPLIRPQEVMLLFADDLFDFYAVPGTSIDLQLDLPAIKEQDKLPYVQQLQQVTPVTFSGQYARLNQEYNNFQPNLFKGDFSFTTNNEMIKSLPPLEYKKFRLTIMQQELDTLQVFNTRYNTSSEFRQLMTQKIRYQAADDLFRYRWLHKDSATANGLTKLPEGYLSFLEDFPLNNEEAIITQSYSNCTREYTYLYNAFGVNTKQADTMFATLTNGIGKDLLYARLINLAPSTQHIPFAEKDLDKYLQNISNTNLQAQLKKNNDLVKQKIEGKLPESTNLRSELDVTADNFFDELIKPYKGKVIYIDFWAPWCGPCMGEMPNSKELHHQLAGKNIVFLYIGVSCTQQSWQNTIKAENIEGEHYLANKNQGMLLGNKFKFSGIPHYALVDKTGKVVTIDAPRPSDKNKILKQINKLL